MNTLENIIREKLPDVPALSFSECVFKKRTRSAHFVFFAAAEVGAETEQKIATLIKFETNVKIEVVVEVLKPPLNSAAVRAALRDYIKNNFFPVYCTLSENDVEADETGNGNITAYVTVKSSLKNYAETNKLTEKCSDFLCSRYLIPASVILRVDAGKNFEEELAEYKARQDGYQKIKPQKAEMTAQQGLFADETAIPAYLLENSFVVFDFETTGFDGIIDKIVEIGAVKIEGGVITEKFSSLINPAVSIPKEVIKVHGITDDMVKHAPKIEEVLPDFLRFAGDSALIAHNADFDAKFLRTAGLASGLTLDFEYIDTVALARRYVPGLNNHKLGTLADYFNTSVKPGHRALDDAHATAEIFIEIIKRRAAK